MVKNMEKYGLLGEKLSHSYSPLIHSLLGDYPYVLTELSPRDAEGFLREHPFRAYNVTIPYKKLALECCDTVSREARAIGSVNTLVVDGEGRLCGYNTDAYGFEYMLKKLPCDVKDKKCLVLGSGGASVTVQYVLKRLGAERITVVSRSGPVTYGDLHSYGDTEIIVNTTPVGMYPSCGRSPVDLDLFPSCRAVLDLIYNPCRTRLLLDAEQRGIPCINGLSMLVAQAKRANELFFSRSIEDDPTDRITGEILSGTLNMTLVGMPGCGKSTVGQILSQLTGRELIDTDVLIAKQEGKAPAQIITEQGEARFREIESRVLERVSKLSSKIIATGGGVVTVEENRSLLRQNSKVFFIERDISALDTRDRPLSASGSLEELYKKRLPLYEAVCDHKVRGEDPLSVARTVLELHTGRRNNTEVI